jgi:hypothetical protein
MNLEEPGMDWDADEDVGDVLSRKECEEEMTAGFLPN